MSTYADRVGEEYERWQARLVVQRGYFTGVREGQLVAQKHRHLAKLVRYHNCATYGWSTKLKKKPRYVMWE